MGDKKWRAGQVAISGVIGPFTGEVDAEVLWNGFYCPRFTREVAEQVAKQSCEDGDYGSWSWDGDTLVMIQKQEYWGEGDSEEEWTERLTPDRDGRYHVGSWQWTWDTFLEPTTIADAPLNSVVRDPQGRHFSITESHFGIDAEGFGVSFPEGYAETLMIVERNVLNWEEVRKHFGTAKVDTAQPV